jgi:Tfp pilus assembly protein PilF
VVGDAVTGSAVARSSADLIGAVWIYLVKLVWPVGLNAYIDAVPTGTVTLAAAVAVTLVLVALALSAWRAGKGMVTFLLAWFLLTLVPSLAIVWKIPEAPMAERYLYLPSVAACLLAGYGVSVLWVGARSPAWRAAVIAPLCTLVAVAAFATWARNRVWHDDLALWSDTAAKSHIAGLPMRSLGIAYLQQGQREEAQRHLELALQRRNSPAGLQVIYNNLGTIALQGQRYDQARQHYEAALQAYPNAADTLFNLGLAILQAGGGSQEAAEGALAYFQRAEQLSPHDADIQAALGQVAAIRGDRDTAIVYLRRALDLGPSPAVERNIQAYLDTLVPPAHQ